MNQTNFWNNGHEPGRPTPGRRRGDTNDSQTLATLPVYITAEHLKVETILPPASTFSRVMARLLAAMKPKLTKQAVKQEQEAIATWEDEGGKAAAKPAKNPAVDRRV